MMRGECRRCGKPFTTKRRDKVYCSDACRYLDWKGRAHEPYPCRYCGMPADTIDHIPPRAARERLQELGLAARFPDIEVWCCHECNCLLGARALWTIELRKRFVKLALRRKYARFLRIPSWTDAEISRLGPNLKDSVLAGIIMREMIEERLQY
jgi:hypothetical protein